MTLQGEKINFNIVTNHICHNSQAQSSRGDVIAVEMKDNKLKMAVTQHHL